MPDEHGLATADEITILQSEMVRATSWDQIFASRDEELSDLEALAKQSAEEVKGQYVKTDDDNGIAYKITAANGAQTVIRKLPNRDVEIIRTFSSGNTQTELVTAHVGNIKHPYKLADLTLPPQDALDKMEEEIIQEYPDKTRPWQAFYATTGLSNPHSLEFAALGKTASDGWEDNMLQEKGGQMPQRIGHRIVSQAYFHARQVLMEKFPELWTPASPSASKGTPQ